MEVERTAKRVSAVYNAALGFWILSDVALKNLRRLALDNFGLLN